MSVLVLGSINMDLVVRTPRLPAPAETITGHEFFTAAGGKGANQAVAAAKLNVATRMFGRVGGDGFGQDLIQSLETDGVDVSAVAVDLEVSSGVAIIAVDDQAQNSIMIVPGANGRVGQPELDKLAVHMAKARVLLLQLEIPLDVTHAAAEIAQQQGVTVILDPAPARSLPPELYSAVDIITPNEIEAAQLVEVPVQSRDEAFTAAGQLLQRGVKTAVIKLGAKGVVFATEDGHRGYVPAFPIRAVDTVAAGDAFNGGLAAGLVNDLPLPEAIRWGAAAGALSATRTGAQPSMPTWHELDRFLQKSD
jgi:ribokinase